MNSPLPALPADLDRLPRWTMLVVLMVVVLEILLFLLSGHLSFLNFGSSHWLDYWQVFGGIFGVPACILWIGGQAQAMNRWLRWLALFIGMGVHAIVAGNGVWDSARGVGSFMGILLAPLGAVAVLAIAQIKFLARSTEATHAAWPRLFGLLAVFLVGLTLLTRAGLTSTIYLFPGTWDYHIYRVDAAFGAIPADFTMAAVSQGPWLQTLTSVVYSALPMSLLLALGLAMRMGAAKRLNIWAVLVIPFILAMATYTWLPLCGPLYAFSSESFPHRMPALSELSAVMVIVPPAYRNGMPSMHLAGALFVWFVCLELRQRLAIWGSALFVLGTAWATLASGEHYLVDLVVALPYAAFIGAMLLRPHVLKASWKVAGPIWLCGLIFLIWMVAFKAAPVWLSLHPWSVRALTGVGTLLALFVYGQHALGRAPTRLVGAEEVSVKAKTPLWVIGTFLVSGMAGLMYEVVYAKALAVTFGSTALASYTVLATYMGGMALGAWIGGRLADRFSNPLKSYALVEVAIGIYAAMTPQLFQAIQSVYVYFSLDVAPDSPGLTALRLVLGVVCLSVPTVLMGTTFPLLFKYLRNSGITTQHAIGPLYSANTIGAAAGSLFAGYFLLPALGRNGGTYMAAVASLLVGLYVLNRQKRMEPLNPQVLLDDAGAPATVERTSEVGRLSGVVAMVVLFVGGVVTLGLEINTIHLLSVVAGNSVYAFALMLSMFLIGLGLGSSASSALAKYFLRGDLMAWAQCGLALSIAITALLWDDIPSYFGAFGLYPVQLGFSARETIRALVCALAMLPPAFFIGMSYPSAMSLMTDWLSPSGGARGVGVASGLNTLGNIVGVLVTGFWILPEYGSRNVSMMFAVIALSLGLLSLLSGYAQPVSSVWAKWRWAPHLAAFGGLFLIPTHWDYDELATGSNVYFRSQPWGTIIDRAESVEGGMTLVAKDEKGVSTLLTNGKFQGNDSAGGEMVAQESFALFPLLHTAERNSALVIGYGTGMTARVLHEAGFKRLEIAELSKDIVTLADKHFFEINRGVTSAPGVGVHYTDGRNFLLTQSAKFDLISIEISSIWFAGAANLYNRDFYALAKNRISDRGVLQQWVQLHHVAPLDLLYIIGSVRAEFQYVWIYMRGGQGIIVASNNELAFKEPGQLSWNHSGGAAERTRPEQLRASLLLSPRGVDNFISGFVPGSSNFVSTDVNLILEHSTPKGNTLGDVLGSNVRLLGSFEPHGNAQGQVMSIGQTMP